MKQLVLFLTVIAALSLTKISFAELSDGLVAYYPFNGNANDESGNGYNGIVYGAILVEDRKGVPNSAFELDGIDDYIYYGKVLPDMSEMTIVAWIYSENENSFFCDGDWASGNDVVLEDIRGNNIQVRADKNGYSLNDDLYISSEIKRNCYYSFSG